jgi:muramoyltetrapeptide carboxypeptidase
MNRKSFLGTFLALASSLRSLGQAGPEADPLPVTLPPYLNTGDLIGICCGSGYITEKELQPSLQVLTGWGFKTVLGRTIGEKDGMFGGTDEERTRDIQQMLDNPEIKAILFARGGYGMVRIIDNLNFTAFMKAPKWLIGFSDVTVIHAHIHRNCRIASIHSKMCNSFPDDFSKAEPDIQNSILSIRTALVGEPMNFTAPYSPLNRPGEATGPWRTWLEPPLTFLRKGKSYSLKTWKNIIITWIVCCGISEGPGSWRSSGGWWWVDSSG